MSSSRVIILREDIYSKFDHDRYGIDIFRERGISVEYWDCSKIFRAKFQGDEKPISSDGFSGVRCFQKKKSLLKSISHLTSQDTVIPAISYNIKTLGVFRHISNTKASWGIPRLGDLPIPKEEISFQGRVEKIIRRPSTVINFLLKKFPPSVLGLRPLDFILQGGTATLAGPIAILKGKKTKILDAHAMDYDRFLLSKNDIDEYEGPEYVVFLDSSNPFHRDHDIFRVRFPCPFETYFSNLNRLFGEIEEQFNCSVVVASHPRVQYEKRENPFEGRKLIQGKTNTLVKYSKFVISTCSTAVNFPVIYKKPIIFLSIKPEKRNHWDNMTRNFASYLGKLPIDMGAEKEIDWEQELIVNKDAYNQYMEEYIKKRGSPEKPCWEILADHLKSIAV